MTAVAVKAEPLFKSTDTALKFAYAIAEVDIYSAPAYLQEIRRKLGKSYRSEKMSPHDWHTQGSMIRQRVAQLDDLLAYYGIATYSWDNRAREISLAALYGHVNSQTPFLRNKLMMRLLVDRYVGTGRRDRPRKAEIARKTGAHHATVAGWERRISAILGPVHAQFFEAMDKYLEDAGLIPPQ